MLDRFLLLGRNEFPRIRKRSVREFPLRSVRRRPRFYYSPRSLAPRKPSIRGEEESPVPFSDPEIKVPFRINRTIGGVEGGEGERERERGDARVPAANDPLDESHKGGVTNCRELFDEL